MHIYDHTVTMGIQHMYQIGWSEMEFAHSSVYIIMLLASISPSERLFVQYVYSVNTGPLALSQTTNKEKQHFM